jgi:phosphoribosylglycinamide formyltransferase-1
MTTSRINIAVFASGSGTNAENLIRYFQNSDIGEVKLVICNKAKAGVLERAAKLDVKTELISREDWQYSEHLLDILKENRIQFIVLAGFLWLMPEQVIAKYEHRIVNIHPALLPKYGGLGMYGNRVHEAVKHNKEVETGITIHYVDAKYDEGKVIFQKSTQIDPTTHSPEEIAQKVHELEYEYYPKVVEGLLREMR